MPKRFQQGSIKKRKLAGGTIWVGQYREGGTRRNVKLGMVSKMTKDDAKRKLAEILQPINSTKEQISPSMVFGDFIRDRYFPFARGKWKASTRSTTQDRIRFHIIEEFDKQQIGSLTSESLQMFLNKKAESGLSRSMVSHLRFDLNAIFKYAEAHKACPINPAKILYTPRGCQKKSESRTMTKEEVQKMLASLCVRERLIVKFALLAGMRPGEIFALKVADVSQGFADIQWRVYRGVIDTPKTENSIREAALPETLMEDLKLWVESVNPEGWLFPSESETPLSRDNVWRRNIRPALTTVGLGWVNFQVLRRTATTFMANADIDVTVRAKQQGNTPEVNELVYRQVPLEKKQAAVTALESALIH
jgi:integrase